MTPGMFQGIKVMYFVAIALFFAAQYLVVDVVHAEPSVCVRACEIERERERERVCA